MSLSPSFEEPNRYPPIVLNQSRLNIEARTRTSRLPWRGQFSPELIEYLLNVICNESEIFLDPFCGSGTILYEAAQKGKKAYGSEINPAAWHLATLSMFSYFSNDEKNYFLAEIKRLLSLLSKPIDCSSYCESSSVFTLELTNASNTHPFLRKILAASIILGMGNSAKLTETAVAKGLFSVLTLLNDLYRYKGKSLCFLGDARKIQLTDASVDAIITSPPYINVFNYHQNYRPAVELLGWKPLEAAPSEIGANRKHRQNRFLTVVQYGLDMAECLDEMARVLKDQSPLVLVVGRTSNVLGVSFGNSSIIKNLLSISENFMVAHIQERVFINRFGEKIYEDIIIAYRQNNGITNSNKAREVGVQALKQAFGGVPNKNCTLLEEAITKADAVLPSPVFNINIPPAFLM